MGDSQYKFGGEESDGLLYQMRVVTATGFTQRGEIKSNKLFVIKKTILKFLA